MPSQSNQTTHIGESPRYRPPWSREKLELMQWLLQSFPFQLLFCLGTGLVFSLLALISAPLPQESKYVRVPLVSYLGEAEEGAGHEKAPVRTIRLKQLHPANRGL